MSTATGSIHEVITPRPAPPEDNLCQSCREVEQKYIRQNEYLCRHCWDRKEYPALAQLSNAEIDEMLAANILKYKDKSNTAKLHTVGF
jgi:hypothetical protein